jgi:DNA helicase-2/ATP-dependent DNA helicase PcrA
MDPDGPLGGLDERQRHAVTVDAAPLAILAPAGSGKTRVLTRRIAHRVATGRAAARHVLAVTFTRKAAGELGRRLVHLGVERGFTAGTFHALALAQLRSHHGDRNAAMPQVLERKGRILAETTAIPRGPAGVAVINELAGEIEWAKARMIRPEQYAEAVARVERRTSRPPAEIAQIYEHYEERKRRRRLVDFDDLLWWCADLLERDRDFGASQRFRFRHLFVDEFQDATPLQIRLVRGWLGGRADLCVVGDDAQAIYSFAGADPSFLQRFDRHFPGGHIVRLGTNYRSTPQVVRASAAVLGRAAGVERPVPEAARGDGPIPSFTEFADERAEAAGVASAIAEARARGIRYGDVAVLYRVNAQSAAFEAALRQAAVPYRLAGASRFVDRPEVKALLGDLRRAAKVQPARPFAALLTDLEVESRVAPEASGLPDGSVEEPDSDDESLAPAVAERAEHAAALVALGHEYLDAEGGGGSLGGFLQWLSAALRGDDGDATRLDAVELCTFHRAKGLEWEAVWVTGLERKLVPISYAQTAAAVAEERRLLHVALSRAAREVHLTWARQRTVGGRVAQRQPSPYVDLVRAANEPGPADRIAPPREALATARAALRASRPPDAAAEPALLAALKEWRLATARAAAVPAYVVFPDRTLSEIAAIRPRGIAELLEVHGIGPAKAERYGSEVLEIVARVPPEA